MSKRTQNLLELTLIIIIALFSFRPVANYDFWFHAKYGEVIWKTHSLPFADFFSHTAYGAPAVPYEWLFQVVLYLVHQTGGFTGVSFLILIFTLGYLLMFRKILQDIFQLGFLPRVILVGSLFFLTYNFWVERPQSVAFFLFMLVLYLVLKMVFLNRNQLVWTIPLFWIWTNLHASMILGLYLFFGFGLVMMVVGAIHESPKPRAHHDAPLQLLIYGVINLVVTLLPPLGTKVYQLLYLFYQKHDFITQAIEEWVPLYQVQTVLLLYFAIMAVAGGMYLWAFWKSEVRSQKYELNKSSQAETGHFVDRTSYFLLLPLIPLGLFVISGVRQTPFSMPAIFLLAVPFLQQFKISLGKHYFWMLVLAIYIVLTIGYYNYREDSLSIKYNYPFKAMAFVQKNIRGNMFNEYHVGGFLMYYLGPSLKTFIDGRTDMFLPTVLPEYLQFTRKTDLSDADYFRAFSGLVSKYHISWAMLTTNKYSLSWRLGRILEDSGLWTPVYFDDNSRIYVKNDGPDGKLVSSFGMVAARPFGKRLYTIREQARQEYRRMNKIISSAVATNALGYLSLEDQKFDEAKKQFEEALRIEPTAAPPKMNLAELAAKDGNYTQAITLYRNALKDDPERGLAYLRLGQLIMQSGGSPSASSGQAREEARAIWQEGLKSTPDEEILAKLRKELGR